VAHRDPVDCEILPGSLGESVGTRSSDFDDEAAAGAVELDC